MEELERRLEHRRARLGPSAADLLARWERGRAKYPAILLAPIHRSAWKGNSANFASWVFSEVRTGLRGMASCSCGGKVKILES
jgi:hypothetical protein